MSGFIEGINQAATASAAKKESDASKKSEEILGKQDFLTLLVAQLQNQDPLNPDDPTEFTAQLAQFSSLEQLFNLNESMDNLVTSNANSDRLSTLSTIGKEVAYTSSTFAYSGEPVTLGYQLDGKATEVTMALKHNGATIAILNGQDLTQGTHYLEWDGLTQNGETAPVGDYTIVLQAKAAEGESVAANPVIRSEVTGVDLEGQFGGTLITEAGEVAFNTILGVFEPGTGTKKSGGENDQGGEEPLNSGEPPADTVVDTITDLVADNQDSGPGTGS